MKITYALQPHPKSIFLAGPTPRDEHGEPWRPEAIAILQRIGFDGEVIVPESEDWAKHDQYDAQIEWEWEGIDRATVVVFWIPRVISSMPAFTTNVEFGMVAASNKAILGYPCDAPKMGYLAALADRHHIPVYMTLESLIFGAVAHSHRWDQKIA